MPDMTAQTRKTPDLSCDLVMKGGITSGVVYPMAVVELARHYRFDSIGGTSAGAIAAVVTAAAEYGRAEGGFEKVARLPDELSTGLLEKFQPVPELGALFNLLIAGLSRRPLTILRAALCGYGGGVFRGALPGLAVLVAGLVGAGWGFGLLGLLMALLGAGIGLVLGLRRDIATRLPRHDYGICPGIGQEGCSGEALTDWMCRTLDDVAGLKAGEGPLTLAHMEARGIKVQTVTTDLTTRRPYALPMQVNTHAFSRREFLRIFPADLVAHMLRHSSPVSVEWNDPEGDLHYFQMKELPLVVLARMSLSFPGLISAVPLWRIDYTLNTPRPVRCLFSDGGISSNFPVHFFDEFLPHTPTFGISLGPLVAERIRPDDPGQGRIHLPIKASDGQQLPSYPITGLGGFIGAMFNTAKDWQDSLQAILPGYRERTVTVNLTEDEGGLNLTMPPERIALLTDLGARAGQEIVTGFDLAEHRWRRYLTEVVALDEALRLFAQNYARQDPQRGTPGYGDLASNGTGGSFKALTKAERAMIRDHAEALANAGVALAALPKLETLKKRLPASRSSVRNRARMDN
jgi:predicted acylesterase/phospholipase RssA